MSDYAPRIKNTELLRCMLALCLDEENIYRRLLRGLEGNIKKEFKKALAAEIEDSTNTQETNLIFGVTHNTLADTVLLPSKNSVNRSTLSNLVRSTMRFRNAYLALYPDSELKYLEPLVWDDFEPEVVFHQNREQHLYRFGEKLGYCKRSQVNGAFELKNGTVELDQMAVIKAVDRKKNTANKPGCGVNIERDLAHKLLDRYLGVYALYYPAAYLHAGAQGYFMSAMRVSHVLEEDNLECSVIRAKLNIPNVTCDAARYQYRGYLTPIGNKDHLHLSFYLATNTINREQCLPKSAPLDPDVVNIICSKMMGKDQVFRGLLTSLSQREAGYSRLPYGAKVLIKRQQFQGSAREVHDAEVRFMQRDGLGYFDSIRALLACISHRKEAAVVEKYFSQDSSGPSIIYSDPVY